ncbi:Peptidyl-prolyl cis-trans isomerase-like 4 [Dimargaris verticillata]|uniref:Peptidyl-prolyl cis-trans isomerase n=1 Tax=Dimargaris verticillata TaxID=2761393 RepID=A0A9W8AWV1_9FUNG|nr:Peptidyl-prolyl cis-trans isomerase-like 4 [Dimargaris verticillata]
MSVLVETSVGDLVIDLHYKECPRTCFNFLKLCRIKYYNFNLFYNVQPGFMVQTGDPTGSGKGGESVWGVTRGSQYRYFHAEVDARLKHDAIGTVSMAIASDPQRDLTVADVDWSQLGTDTTDPTTAAARRDSPISGSQFFITTGPQLDYLDGKYAVFGHVAEGLDVLTRINDAYCDDKGRPFQDIRIRHTIILHDPFPNPPNLTIPDRSPLPTPQQLADVRLADHELVEDPDQSDAEAREQAQKEKDARAQALTLEMIGDLPFAEIRPPENILFVCKLNPVTSDEDLQMIFSRFGTIISCQVIRDHKSQQSLGYAFIEFSRKEDCEQAYFKMDNVLIDDRRIHVDFSQSVSKLHQQWVQRQVDDRGRQAQGNNSSHLGPTKGSARYNSNHHPLPPRPAGVGPQLKAEYRRPMAIPAGRGRLDQSQHHRMVFKTADAGPPPARRDPSPPPVSKRSSRTRPSRWDRDESQTHQAKSRRRHRRSRSRERKRSRSRSRSRHRRHHRSSRH